MRFDALTGQVLIQTPGCSDILAEDALRKAAIRLCEEARVWRDTATFATRDQDNDLEVPQQARAVDVVRAWIDGSEIEPTTPESCDQFEDAGVPTRYYRTSDNVLRLVPAPSESVSLTVESILAPTNNASTIPDDIAERCRMALIYGALAYLLALNGQPWAQPALAGSYAQLFDAEINSLATQEAKGRVRAALRSRARFF